MKKNIPNLISISRLIVAFPLAYYMYYDNKLIVLILAIYGILSDFLDGYFARKYDVVSEMGKILDPLADKSVIILTGLALLLTERLPIWFAVLIISRDVLIIIGATYISKKQNFVPPSNWIGKYTVNFIALAILLIVFGVSEFKYGNLVIDLSIYLASILSIVSLISYSRRVFDVRVN